MFFLRFVEFNQGYVHILPKFYCFGARSDPSLVVKSLLPTLATRDSSTVSSSYSGFDPGVVISNTDISWKSSINIMME